MSYLSAHLCYTCSCAAIAFRTHALRWCREEGRAVAGGGGGWKDCSTQRLFISKYIKERVWMRKSERVKKRDGGDTPLSMHLSYNNGSRMQLVVASFATGDTSPSLCIWQIE